MKERDFSIRTRRSTRVAIRIPVQIQFRSEAGDEEIFGAWTLIVNRHGARCQAERPLEPNLEVLLKNATNGRSATAVVVWGSNQPDATGKFEFAVALRELCNLWQIHFPTHEEPQDLESAECPPVPADEAPPPLKLQPLQPAEAAIATESAPAAEHEVAGRVEQFGPDSDIPTGPSHPPACVSITHVEAEECMNHPENSYSPQPASVVAQPCEPHQRLTDAVNDVIASALRSRIESEAGRLTQERISQIDERASAIASEQLQRIIAVGEQYRRSVQEKAEEVVSTSLADLIQRIVQKMPPIEEEIVRRCQHEAEQAASAAVETASDKLSREFHTAVSTLAERETALLRQVAELEQRILQQIENSAHQLEAQLAETAKEAWNGHASSLIEGINAAQKNLVLEAEAKLATSSEQLISEIRNGFAGTLQELARSFGDCQTEQPAKHSVTRAEDFNASTDPAWEDPGYPQNGSALQSSLT